MQTQVPHIATVPCVEMFYDAEAQEEIRANHAETCRRLHDRFADMARRRGEIDAAASKSEESSDDVQRFTQRASRVPCDRQR